MNLVLFALAAIVLKKKKNLKHETKIFLLLTKKINLFLFIFNMIPIGIFDGAKVFRGLWMTFAG